MKYAGFWLRVAAALIDLMILGVVLAVIISFLSVAQGTSEGFLRLHPGESAEEIAAAFGANFMVEILGIFLLGSWIYFAGMESSAMRGTLGKKLLSLQVTDLQEGRVTFLRASLRFASGRLLAHVPVVGGIYFLVDCICAGFTEKKQALHDLAAGSLVVKGKNVVTQ